MALKHYVVVAIIGTLISWLAWVLVLVNIDPFVSGTLGLTSFYASLFLALLGTFSLFGFLSRRVFSKKGVAFQHVGVSVRQATFLSLVIIGALLLRGTNLYTWWVILFLIATFTLLEFFFLTREST